MFDLFPLFACELVLTNALMQEGEQIYLYFYFYLSWTQTLSSVILILACNGNITLLAQIYLY